MIVRKTEIPICKKIIIKNKSPKNKEHFPKIITKIDIKSHKPTIKSLNIYLNEKKSTSKVNLFNDDKIKNNIIKKDPNNKPKKRQNKFSKKKLKEREPSNLNSNLNIYKIINSKETKSNIIPHHQSSSIATDSVNSYTSDVSNKNSNNKCISLFNKSDNNDSFKRKRLDPDISNNSWNRKKFYTNKENIEKVQRLNIFNAINHVNKNNIKNKDLNNNKKINMNKRFINGNNREKNLIRNNKIELSNFEGKKDDKIKETNSNKIYGIKSQFNFIFNKNSNSNISVNNYKKNSKERKKNIIKQQIYKDIEIQNKFNNNDKYSNKDNNNNNQKKEFDFLRYDKKIKTHNSNSNIENGGYFLELNLNPYYINNDNNISQQKKEENCFYKKKNFKPVKKSLFSEHMNFLINRQEENAIYNNNNYDIINNNCPKFQFDNLLDSTDRKDYESKFINYDLGKTTGTSISKDSLFLFGNKNICEKNKNSKIFNLPKNEDFEKNVEEKERTQEEMEKIAKKYLNMSKYWENRDEYNNQRINQTNTITTVIDDNNSNEDTIL